MCKVVNRSPSNIEGEGRMISLSTFSIKSEKTKIEAKKSKLCYKAASIVINVINNLYV